MSEQTKPAPAESRVLVKPLMVWLAQLICALVAAASLYFSWLLPSTSSALVLAGFGLLYLGLLIALEKRRPWARMLVIGFFALTAISALVEVLRQLAVGSDNTTSQLSGAITFLICTIVAVHFLFGEPVRTFFGLKPPPPAKTKVPRSDDPYAPPTE